MRQRNSKEDFHKNEDDITIQSETKTNQSKMRVDEYIQENVRKVGMQLSPEKKDHILIIEKDKEQSIHSSTDDILKVNIISIKT